MDRLKDLHVHINELRQLSLENPHALLNQDLLDFFEELQTLITADEIEVGLEIINNGTLVLEEKLHQIKEFVSLLTQKEKILQFLKQSPPDHILSSYFQEIWSAPFINPSIALSFLENSWNRLTSYKNKAAKIKLPTESPQIDEKVTNIIENTKILFEERLLNYLAEIQSHLPATLDTLLASEANTHTYFEHFSMILFLLQEGYLIYNPTTGQFSSDQVAMNEFSILMAKMSSFAINPETGVLQYRGTNTDDLCKALNLQGKYGKITLFNKLASFSQYINLLGMKVKQNPFNKRWFIGYKSELNKVNQTNPFENRPKLGATLYVILALILTHRKEISIDLIKQYRKKQQILDDLKQLASMKFIRINESNKVMIHPNLGYYLEFSQILESFNQIDFENFKE